MLPIASGFSQYFALAIIFAVILLGYFKGRNVVSATIPSPGWTQIPLIAFAIACLGPSILAVAIYLGYAFGLIQARPPGYAFSIFVFIQPLDFAVINWGFVALYLVCRLWPKFGTARLAMGLSVVAMSLPNVLLFGLAREMVSNAFDAGQGIGFIEAMLTLPITTNFWTGPAPKIFDMGYGIGFIISALMAPIPFVGLIGWLLGHAVGWAWHHCARTATGPT